MALTKIQKAVIAYVMYLSNTDHVNDCHEMQGNLETISEQLLTAFPNIEECEDGPNLPE